MLVSEKEDPRNYGYVLHNGVSTFLKVIFKLARSAGASRTGILGFVAVINYCCYSWAPFFNQKVFVVFVIVVARP